MFPETPVAGAAQPRRWAYLNFALKRPQFMKIMNLSFLVLISAANLNSYAENPPQDNSKKPINIELKSSSDIQDAMKMQKAYEPLLNKVAECFDKNLAQSSIECYCLYLTEASHAKKTYENTLIKHPNWRDQGIYWWFSDDKKSYQLSFYGLKHRFEQKCPTHHSRGTR